MITNLQVLETRRQERITEYKEAIQRKDIQMLQELIGKRIDEIISNKDTKHIFFDKDKEIIKYQKAISNIFDNK